jgi:hypothetical protein
MIYLSNLGLLKAMRESLKKDSLFIEYKTVLMNIINEMKNIGSKDD